MPNTTRVPAITDRDILIRVDTDLKNLDTKVDDIQQKQSEAERTTADLSKSLLTLTHNVGAMVEGMRDAKEAMTTIGKHDHRILLIERNFDELQKDVNKDLETIKTTMKENRAMFEPAAVFFGHWKWLVAGGVAVLGIVGWPIISKILLAVAVL